MSPQNSNRKVSAHCIAPLLGPGTEHGPRERKQLRWIGGPEVVATCGGCHRWPRSVSLFCTIAVARYFRSWLVCSGLVLFPVSFRESLAVSSRFLSQSQIPDCPTFKGHWELGVRKMAQSVKCLLCRHEDLTSDLQPYIHSRTW